MVVLFVVDVFWEGVVYVVVFWWGVGNVGIDVWNWDVYC